MAGAQLKLLSMPRLSPHGPGRTSGLRSATPDQDPERLLAERDAQLRHLQERLAEAEESVRQLRGEVEARECELSRSTGRLAEVDSEGASEAPAKPRVPPSDGAVLFAPSTNDECGESAQVEGSEVKFA